jgi:hypothetical protein
MQKNKFILLKNKNSKGLRPWDYHIEPEKIFRLVQKESKGWQVIGVFETEEQASKHCDKEILSAQADLVSFAIKTGKSNLSINELERLIDGGDNEPA